MVRMPSRVRVRSNEHVVKDAEIELLGEDGEYHDVSRCVTGVTIKLNVGELSTVHLDTLLADVDVEALELDEATVQTFAFQLKLHGWTVAPPPEEVAAG